ncbi:hypothetical protein Pcinc_014596 [Petrolisthes cinctipes]|uniref:Regulatory protein zeste n=1 Tax=Petrolisthes cinctipes TaxID=88211 RepID=A0AAE1FW91_PETCI|nr:hypothetical protein Pcinc_014596 [Petrolisthes cinctipes]
MASYVYSAPTKKRKQATFTEDELEVMVTEVTERKQVIFPAFSETITRRLKDTAWREVTAAVNRVSRAGRRSEQDVSKKFRDYRSSLKNKIPKHRSEVKKTGTGKRDIGGASSLYRHDTAWETEEVPNEAEVVLPCINIQLAPLHRFSPSVANV